MEEEATPCLMPIAAIAIISVTEEWSFMVVTGALGIV